MKIHNLIGKGSNVSAYHCVPYIVGFHLERTNLLTESPIFHTKLSYTKIKTVTINDFSSSIGIS